MRNLRSYAIALLVTLSSPFGASADVGTALTADKLRTTADGNRFVAPAEWSIRASGPAVILTTPENDSHLALIDVAAQDANAATAAAWAHYVEKPRWPLGEVSERPDRNGWTQIHSYRYEVPVSAGRVVFARASRYGERWTVVIGDFSTAVFNMRESQLTRVMGRLFPKGYTHVPETFAGKTTHKLDAARIEVLKQFVEDARRTLDVPGVALGIVQDGRVVFAGGFGERELGRAGKVDADTLFLSASITKPLTTLMLAKLVDAGKFTWDTPVPEVLPGFKVGDEALTRKLRMRHLVCACTGMPRQDMESIFASEGSTPKSVLELLAKTRPTAELGEVYQYSNPIVAAAGYAGGFALHPEMELGAAYDAAMQELVFNPLGMAATTFDYVRAERGNYATPHGRELAGTTVRASMDFNYTSITMRPDGGAWSSVNDLLRYVRMELASGRLPDGRRYIDEAPLLARREPQVPRGGENQAYGMGLKIDRNQGTPIIWHGGSMAGYQTDMQWLPEHGVGYVLLTNADAGVHLRSLIPRRLLEVLFDAQPEAVANLALVAKQLEKEARADLKELTLPADAEFAAGLASRYRSVELGDIDVERKGTTTWFDFGIWDSEVATRRDADGAVVFVTSSPSVAGYQFVVADRKGQRALALNDGQREYLFVEVKEVASH